MEEAYEILLKKEKELARVKRELEALRVVVPLLRDEDDQVAEPDGAFVTQFALGLSRRLANVRNFTGRPEDSYDATQDSVGRGH